MKEHEISRAPNNCENRLHWAARTCLQSTIWYHEPVSNRAIKDFLQSRHDGEPFVMFSVYCSHISQLCSVEPKQLTFFVGKRTWSGQFDLSSSFFVKLFFFTILLSISRLPRTSLFCTSIRLDMYWSASRSMRRFQCSTNKWRKVYGIFHDFKVL